MTAETVMLGKTGIRSSSLALGCSRLGSALTPMAPRASLDLLARAFALGIRHFDTASVYGQGDSERLIGRAMRRYRAEVCIATKAGQRLSLAQALAARFKPPLRLLAKYRSSVRARVARARQAGLNHCFEPEHLQRSLEESLRRLGTDYVDIFYLHSPSIEVLDRDDVLWCLLKLQSAGKARALGVSCESAEEMAASVRLDGVAVVQASWEADPRCEQALHLAAERGKAILLRAGAPAACSASGVDTAGSLQSRLRAIFALPAVAGAIVGTTHPGHLEDNVAAWRAVLDAASG